LVRSEQQRLIPVSSSAVAVSQAAVLVHTPHVLTDLQDLPRRPPQYGSEGRKISVFANHFRVTKIPNIRVYQYALVIPTKDGGAPTKGLATAIWQSQEVKDALGNEFYNSAIFNGSQF
jgi:hypothetical protein